MAWLIDTNVLSELRKGARSDQGVRAWFEQVDDSDIYTSVLVIGEIRRGIELIRRRDPSSASTLEQWLQRLRESFDDRILSIDATIADRWGSLNVPDPVATVDGLLAATALVHNLTLVTRNTRDIKSTGAETLDPFMC